MLALFKVQTVPAKESAPGHFCGKAEISVGGANAIVHVKFRQTNPTGIRKIHEHVGVVVEQFARSCRTG